MRFKLHHPLWTHVPAVGLLVLLIVRTWQASPFPAQAPVHFGTSGRPDRFGSPWEMVISTIGLGILYLLLSALGDEMWARHEKHKRFNWLSLLDELIIGFMGGILLDYFRMLKTGDYLFQFPWNDALMLMVPAAALAVGLEILRPFNPMVTLPVEKDTSSLETSISDRVSSGQSVVHWESQHNPYITTPMIIIGLGFLIASALTVGRPGLPYAFLINGLFFIGISVIFYGLSVTVTPEKILVRLDVLGFRLLTLNMNDVSNAEVLEFSPLADFGGWGIRFNMKMRGYFWRGNRGVVFTMNNGKEFLIGSDDPERLAAVVKGMREAAG